MPSSTIEAAAAESELIGKALEMAETAHAGQTRNGSGGMAYIHHPVAVAELLAEHGFDERRSPPPCCTTSSRTARRASRTSPPASASGSRIWSRR